MAKLSDFKDRKEFMAYVRSLKGKSDKPKKEKKTKVGKGLMSDLLSSVKNMAINEGEKLLKEKTTELIDKGLNKLKGKGVKKTMKAKGLLGDIAKGILKTGLDMAPIPGIVKNIGSNVGELLIEKVGGNLNPSIMVSKDSTIMKKKKSGKALKVLGGKALKM